jgi:hypothetical protein
LIPYQPHKAKLPGTAIMMDDALPWRFGTTLAPASQRSTSPHANRPESCAKMKAFYLALVQA